MLNFVYNSVSAVLWFWHKVFAFVLGDPTSGLAWSLAVIFLVFTIRVVLLKPFLMQLESQRLQPQIQALRKRYSGNKQALAVQIRNLHKENGSRPVLGLLPVLIQAPVFIGLFHVLRSFDRTGTQTHLPFMAGPQPMSVAENAATANYVFGPGDVQSFLDAKLFGAPLSATITTPAAQLVALGGDVDKLSILMVAIPFIILAAVATYFTTRAAAAKNAAMNRFLPWLAPAGALIAGPFMPVAILLYWISNNSWTFVQQHLVFRRWTEPVPKITSATAPRPGARPTQYRNSKRRQ